MTDKELRKLSRADLLELLLEQSKEVERLEAELAAAAGQLEDRRIAAAKAGSIAQASLQLNGVFQAAQQAADQYVENIRLQSEAATQRLETAKQKAAQTEAQCREMEAASRARCDRMVQQAQEQADAYWRAARRQAEQYWSSPSPHLKAITETPEQAGEEEP